MPSPRTGGAVFGSPGRKPWDSVRDEKEVPERRLALLAAQGAPTELVRCRASFPGLPPWATQVGPSGAGTAAAQCSIYMRHYTSVPSRSFLRVPRLRCSQPCITPSRTAAHSAAVAPRDSCLTAHSCPLPIAYCLRPGSDRFGVAWPKRAERSASDADATAEGRGPGQGQSSIVNWLFDRLRAGNGPCGGGDSLPISSIGIQSPLPGGQSSIVNGQLAMVNVGGRGQSPDQQHRGTVPVARGTVPALGPSRPPKTTIRAERPKTCNVNRRTGSVSV